MADLHVQRWQGESSPPIDDLRGELEGEGLSFYSWSNGPGFHYGAHRHSFDKVILVARGSITFGLPDRGQAIDLAVGDRLELPAGMLHDAQVGPDGVACFEAHR